MNKGRKIRQVASIRTSWVHEIDHCTIMFNKYHDKLEDLNLSGFLCNGNSTRLVPVFGDLIKKGHNVPVSLLTASTTKGWSHGI